MTFREPDIDPALEWLRRGHRSERMPDALRRRALATARSRPSVNRARSKRERWLAGPLALAAVIAGGVWLGVAGYGTDDGQIRAGARRSAPADVVPGAEPSGPRSPSSPGCPEPLPTLRDDLQVDMGVKVMGFEAAALDTESKGCGPLTRRYLIRMPAGDASSAPLLIVLHDGGQSPEQAQLVTRWWFNDLARRERAVLVYANGAVGLGGPDARWINAGVWQTDERAHPAVDDFEYLRRVVDDVRQRRGLAPTGDVFLAGQGSGGLMALAAAVRHPERYAGVAAFMPGRSATAGEFKLEAPSLPSDRRLRAVFIALTDAAGANENPSALAGRWACAFASEPGPVRVSRQQAGIERVDASLAKAVALRIVRLAGEVDPFPGPGGDDPITRAASERRPSFFDGPGAAWAFFRQPNP